MNNHKLVILILLMMSVLLFSGCSKRKEPLELSIELNVKNVTSNPMTVEHGNAFSTNIDDYILCEHIDDVEVFVTVIDGTESSSLPAFYSYEKSPYYITFTDTITGDVIGLQIDVTKEFSNEVSNQTNIEDYDPQNDPGYDPVDLDEIDDDFFEPETYNESGIYLYYSNLEVLTNIDGFMPDSAYADLRQKTQDFIELYSDAMNWPQAESCYILESSIYQSEEYNSFNIYVNPIDKLEIKVYFYPATGFSFEIVSS